MKHSDFLNKVTTEVTNIQNVDNNIMDRNGNVMSMGGIFPNFPGFKKIQSGNEMCGFLTNDNKLYIQGTNAGRTNFISGFINEIGLISGLTTNGFVQPVLPYTDIPVRDFALIDRNLYVLYENDELWGTGANYKGELGLGDTSRRYKPNLLYTGVKRILSNIGANGTSPGYNNYYTFFFETHDKKVMTAGYNANGELGVGDTDDRNTFTQVVGLPDDYDTLDAYINSTHIGNKFIIIDKTRVFVTGYNKYGYLGTGDAGTLTEWTEVTDNWNPDGWEIVKVSQAGHRYNGDDHYNQQSSAMLLTDGSTWKVMTAGYNGHGQLGDGSTTNNATPQKVFETDVPVKEFTKQNSINGALVLLENGELYGWGYNGYGQLGTGDNDNVLSPTLLETDVELILSTTFQQHLTYDWASETFIKKTDGKIYTTGYNNYGQLALGDTTDRNVFTSIPLPLDVSSNVKYIEEIQGVSTSRIYLLETFDKQLWIWGGNNNYMLSNLNQNNFLSPVRIV